jgi:hypothetical protein
MFTRVYAPFAQASGSDINIIRQCNLEQIDDDNSPNSHILQSSHVAGLTGTNRFRDPQNICARGQSFRGARGSFFLLNLLVLFLKSFAGEFGTGIH